MGTMCEIQEKIIKSSSFHGAAGMRTGKQSHGNQKRSGRGRRLTRVLAAWLMVFALLMGTLATAPAFAGETADPAEEEVLSQEETGAKEETGDKTEEKNQGGGILPALSDAVSALEQTLGLEDEDAQQATAGKADGEDAAGAEAAKENAAGEDVAGAAAALYEESIAGSSSPRRVRRNAPSAGVQVWVPVDESDVVSGEQYLLVIPDTNKMLSIGESDSSRKPGGETVTISKTTEKSVTIDTTQVTDTEDKIYQSSITNSGMEEVDQWKLTDPNDGKGYILT